MLKRMATLLSLILVCGAAGFVGGTIAFLNRPIPPPEGLPETVRANRFQVINERRRVAAELTSDGLNLFGRDGNIRATLRLQEDDCPVLAFSDGKWEGRVLFGALGPKDWGLVMFHPDRRSPVVELSTDAQGKRGFLSVWSDKGVRTTSAPE